MRLATVGAMEQKTVPDILKNYVYVENRQEYRRILSKYKEQIQSIWIGLLRCRQDSCSAILVHVAILQLATGEVPGQILPTRGGKMLEISGDR